MSSPTDGGPFLTATTESGVLIIHPSPITLSWIPLDVVNKAYNVGGTVTVGTFDSLDEAKRVASEQYSVAVDNWQVTDVLPFDSGDGTKTENHTPDIDGHNFIRHGIRWK
jgi:hypothetical protein